MFLMFMPRFKRVSFFWWLFGFSTTAILSLLSTLYISNPDLSNYRVLFFACSIFHFCSVEPIFWLISDLARALRLELTGLYAIYIFGTLFFISRAGNLILGARSYRSIIFIVLWFSTFGMLHTLVQIRFGLGAAIALYVIALATSNMFAKFFAIISVSSHFSMALVPLWVFLRDFFHSGFAVFNILVAFFLVFLQSDFFVNIFPSFFVGRIMGYLSGDSAVSLSAFSISLFFYIYIVVIYYLRRVGADYLLAAIGFLPYIFARDFEIFIRFGVPFQYFLLLIFVRDFFYRPITLFPVFAFFVYKFLSTLTYIPILLTM